MQMLKVLIWCLLLTCSAAFANTPKLTMVCSAHQDSLGFKYSQYILEKSLAELGYQLTLLPVTAQEAIQALNTGNIDGDCARLGSFLKLTKLQNYLQSSQAISSIIHAAWSNHKAHLRDLNLAVTSRSIGTTKGYITALSHPVTALTIKSSTQAGVAALNKGEIDIWLDYSLAIQALPEKQQPRYSKILMSQPVFPILHKRHKQIMSQFEQQLLKHALETPFRVFREMHHPVTDSNLKRDKDTIVFVCTIDPTSILYKEAYDFYNSVFKQLNRKFVMRYAPPARAVLDLINGQADGTCGRTIWLEKLWPNADLIRINTPISYNSYQAWSHDPNFIVNNFDDIAEKKYRAAYKRGYLNITHFTADRNDLDLMTVSQISHGLKMLAAKRIDIFIGHNIEITKSLRGESINSPLYLVGEILKEPSYVYLHGRHKALSSEFALVFRENLEKYKDILTLESENL